MGTDDEYKLVRLKLATVGRVEKHGVFGDSFDDAINKVLDLAESKKAR